MILHQALLVEILLLASVQQQRRLLSPWQTLLPDLQTQHSTNVTLIPTLAMIAQKQVPTTH
jgi:hypothetical protein